MTKLNRWWKTYVKSIRKDVVVMLLAEMIPMVDHFKDAFQQFSVNIKEYEMLMKSEKTRRRANGESVYYQEVYLPGSVLKHVYVRDEGLVEQVSVVLRERGFNLMKCVCPRYSV